MHQGEIPKAKSKMFWSPPDKDSRNILMACRNSALFNIHFVLPSFPRKDADSESLHPVGAVIKMAKRWNMPKGMKSVKMVEPEKKPRAKAKAKAKAQAELKFKDRCRGCCTKSRRKYDKLHGWLAQESED